MKNKNKNLTTDKKNSKCQTNTNYVFQRKTMQITTEDEKKTKIKKMIKKTEHYKNPN